MLEAVVASDQHGCRTPLLGNEHGQRARPIPIPPPTIILEKKIARSGSLSESVREVDGVKKVVLDVLDN